MPPLPDSSDDEDENDEKLKQEGDLTSEASEESKEEEEPTDLINAHFEKVQRSKLKFRLYLQDIMIHMSGKDYIVKKMTADIFY